MRTCRSLPCVPVSAHTASWTSRSWSLACRGSYRRFDFHWSETYYSLLFSATPFKVVLISSHPASHTQLIVVANHVSEEYAFIQEHFSRVIPIRAQRSKGRLRYEDLSREHLENLPEEIQEALVKAHLPLREYRVSAVLRTRIDM
jgi:hypothetical protein